jgi:hypothetical protein
MNKELFSKVCIKEYCNVMAIFNFRQFEEDKDGFVQIAEIGKYKKIDKSIIKKDMFKPEGLEVNTHDIEFNTGKTIFSYYFYEKATKICDVLGQDWDFEVLEQDTPNQPIILVNSYGTAFLIAPRVYNEESADLQEKTHKE